MTFSINTSNTTRVTVDAVGNVAIRVITPTARLEISGRVSATVVQLNDDGVACTAATKGTIRIDPVSGKPQISRQL